MSTFDHEALCEEFVQSFPVRAARFSRVLTRAAHSDFPRGMAHLLASVQEGQCSVTQLAEQEGLAQPTVTNMIIRLERLGLVTRQRAAHDRRVVLVELTPAGLDKLRDMRTRHRNTLRSQLTSLPDEELLELVRASDALQRLIDRLQSAQSEADPVAAAS